MKQAGTVGERLEIGGDGRGHEETGTDRTERDRNGHAGNRLESKGDSQGP
jgi:hypothetical protein